MPTFEEYPYTHSLRRDANLAERHDLVGRVLDVLTVGYPQESEVVQRVENYLRYRTSLRVLRDMGFLASIMRR
ncbi:MAG: hypothetical protein J3T61_00620 [Candidatus Brocadiales bacterium]|nr:hypothetical protein [Candidatus Bathyanammoxibius sp.]